MKHVVLICIFFCLYSKVLSGSSETKGFQEVFPFKDEVIDDNNDNNEDGNDSDNGDDNDDDNDEDKGDDKGDDNGDDNDEDKSENKSKDKSDDNGDDNGEDKSGDKSEDKIDDNGEDKSDDSGEDQVPKSDCWMTLNATKHFKTLDEIDKRYAKIRKEIQESLKEIDFDNAMIQGFRRERGIALREVYAHHHNTWMIPSGLNLGGLCMLRMPGSVLFFHRMKLRNNTFFRVDFLHNNLTKMVVTMHLSLNDLHLMGAYERAMTSLDAAELVYAPTFGQVEFLMKDVKFKMEGRYRLINNRLMIELISSEIIANDILMMYINKAIESAPKKVERNNLESFIGRLKTDLDKWLKDYFNDYMIYAEMDGIPHMDELSKYDKEKGTALEEFTDSAIQAIANRIWELDASNLKLPAFTLKSIHGLQVRLTDGTLYGLDSIYRRSVATGYNERGVHKTDCIVGFSNLKVIYKYEAMVPTGVPPLTGALTLSSNELSAHLALAVVVNPETVDLDIEFLDQMKPESLTVEGPANLMIANFKHLLEHQIAAIMSNTLLYGVLMLKSLPRCEPFVPGMVTTRKPPETTSREFVETLNYDEYPIGRKPKSLMKISNRNDKKKNVPKNEKKNERKNEKKNERKNEKKNERKNKKKNEKQQKKIKRKNKKATSRSKTLPRGKIIK